MLAAAPEQQSATEVTVVPFGTQQVPMLLQMKPLEQGGAHVPLPPWQTPLTQDAPPVQV